MKEIIYKLRQINLYEKFPNYKAFVQDDKIGNIIDIFPTDEKNNFSDEEGIYVLTIEQALKLVKLLPSKKFCINKDDEYYDYISSKLEKV